MESQPLSPRVLLAAANIRPNKNRGQNFLSDAKTARGIVEKAGIQATDTVLEIGAGLGALTLPLAAKAARVYAVEWDKRLFDLLSKRLEGSDAQNVVLIREDILNMDFTALAAQAGGALVAVGNLPYYISSQILAKTVLERTAFKKAVYMFQKEMAQRMAALPGGKDYGRLSVVSQYAARISPLAQVSAAQFHPRPGVESLVLEFAFLFPPPHAALSEPLFFSIVKAAFAKRRKTLKNTLSTSGLGYSQSQVLTALEAAGIDPSRRAETLSVPEFVCLADAFLALGKPEEEQNLEVLAP